MDWNLLRNLCAVSGASGEEGSVREILREKLRGGNIAVREDALGNLLVEKKGKAPARTRLLLAAHMDAPGLMVTQITEDGFLKVESVGRLYEESLCGCTVKIDGISGVIGEKPVHLMDAAERAKPVPLDQLTIDIGASSKEEAEKYVSVGKIVSLDSSFTVQHNMVCGRALESHAACAILLEYLLSDLPYDVTAAFCALGHTGFLGAKTAAYTLRPQAVLSLSALESDTKENACKLGKGPAVLLMDKGAIYDRVYLSWALDQAKRLEIPVQTVRPQTAQTDASQAHSALAGCRAAAIGIPCRYIGGPAEMMTHSDVEYAGKLLAAVAEQIAGASAV